MPMIFSRDIFPLVRGLQAHEFQSLLNYSSSRCRAAANTFVLTCRDTGKEELFMEALSRELVGLYYL